VPALAVGPRRPQCCRLAHPHRQGHRSRPADASPSYKRPERLRGGAHRKNRAAPETPFGGRESFNQTNTIACQRPASPWRANPRTAGREGLRSAPTSIQCARHLSRVINSADAQKKHETTLPCGRGKAIHHAQRVTLKRGIWSAVAATFQVASVTVTRVSAGQLVFLTLRSAVAVVSLSWRTH
jgi:hypothetical protein